MTLQLRAGDHLGSFNLLGNDAVAIVVNGYRVTVYDDLVRVDADCAVEERSEQVVVVILVAEEVVKLVGGGVDSCETLGASAVARVNDVDVLVVVPVTHESDLSSQ